MLTGHHLLPRDVAKLCRPRWHDWELTKAVATCLGESQGHVGAYHDNTDDAGDRVSRDCGLMQINIHARDIGTDVERELRTDSGVRTEYWKVAEQNVAAAYALYEQPWPDHTIRLWQPWVAYTTGWATFPEFWVWHQEDGKPVGPWLPTGRYVQTAIAGIANYHVKTLGEWTLAEGVDYATKAAAHFGVRTVVHTPHGSVSLVVPPVPPKPPRDGVGPRPAANDGT